MPPSFGFTLEVDQLEALDKFDALIDVRSPAEFELDHLPNAVNYPVLDDTQRHEVGLLHAKDSFAARRLGAAWVASNCAHHIETHLMHHSRHWRPLVYCWRGGQRSGALVHILHQIGWPAMQLIGGYKTWRRRVIDDLATWPQRFDFKIISGPTGCGKSRLLEALRANGAQVLHLEQIANHKGSILGSEGLQPGQRLFETRLWEALRGLDPGRPVFAEAESRRIGRVALPEQLLLALRSAKCLRIEAPLPARVAFLLADYAPRLKQPEWLIGHLQKFIPMHGAQKTTQWCEQVNQRDFRTLTEDLLTSHYDQLYRKSLAGNYTRPVCTLEIDDLSTQGINALARRLPECL